MRGEALGACDPIGNHICMYTAHSLTQNNAKSTLKDVIFTPKTPSPQTPLLVGEETLISNPILQAPPLRMPTHPDPGYTTGCTVFIVP